MKQHQGNDLDSIRALATKDREPPPIDSPFAPLDERAGCAALACGTTFWPCLATIPSFVKKLDWIHGAAKACPALPSLRHRSDFIVSNASLSNASDQLFALVERDRLLSD